MDTIKLKNRIIIGLLVASVLISCSFLNSFPIGQSNTLSHTQTAGQEVNATDLPVWAIAATNAASTQVSNQTLSGGDFVFQSTSENNATEPENPNSTGMSQPLITSSENDSSTPTQEITVKATVKSTEQQLIAKDYPVFGMQMSLLTAEEGIAQTALVGAHWVQAAAVSWAKVESYERERNWAALSGREQEWVNAASLSLVPIVTIHFTPTWAQKNSGYSCGPISKDKFSAFGNFLHDLVARYSQPPYNIKYWQIWNEADAGFGLTAADSPWGCWGDTSDQKYYGGDYFGKMLKVIYPRIKEADPQAQVLIGGLLLDCDPFFPPETTAGSGNYKDCSTSNFLKGILSAGAGDYFDGISFHSYDYYQGELGKYSNINWNSSWDKNGPVLTVKSNFIKNILSGYGVKNKLLINTESGIICGSTGEEAVCTDDTFVQTKAYYVVQAYALSIAENLDANLWFSLKGWRASGLLDGNLQPVPAYNAYYFASQQLNGCAFDKYLVEYPGVRGLIFQKGQQHIWVLWSMDGNAHTIQLNSSPREIYNVYGEAQPVGTQLTVTQAPIYLTWSQ